MRIIYMHHAQRDNKGGVSQENPITELGKRESEIIAEMFKGVSLKAIYSGEYLRYLQTVEIVKGNLDVPVKTDKRLNEWVSKTEERKSFRNRTHSFLKEIVANHDNDDTIICMTSGVNLHEFVTFFNGNKPVEGFQIMQAVGLCPIIFYYNKWW